MSEAQEAKIQSHQVFSKPRSFPLGGKEYYFEIEVFHPLGSLSLAKMWTKLPLINNSVTWDLKNNG